MNIPRGSRRAIFAAAACIAAVPALAGDLNVGVTVAGQIQPGVYGRVDIGNMQPALVYAQPMVIVAPPRGVAYEPIYLNVPPGHARKWSKHCAAYNACNRPVYFVRTDEYRYFVGGERHGREDRDEDRGHGRGRGRGHGRDRD